MNDLFKINNKIKPLVKVPDFTFIDYHNLQPSICYYIRKYDDHNDFDLMEAKIVKTNNKVKDRYTLGAGTSIKVLDSFMYYYLKIRNTDVIYSNKNLIYKDFINQALKDANITDKTIIERYSDGTIPKSFKMSAKYHNILGNKFEILYVERSSKDKKLEQIYIVFVKELKEQVMNTEISYIIFKPVRLMTKMDYLKGKTKDQYSVYEYPEICIPTSILK